MAQFETHKRTAQGKAQTLERRTARALKSGATGGSNQGVELGIVTRAGPSPSISLRRATTRLESSHRCWAMA